MEKHTQTSSAGMTFINKLEKKDVTQAFENIFGFAHIIALWYRSGIP